ncbi:unnamed protein product [Caretta caretta]
MASIVHSHTHCPIGKGKSSRNRNYGPIHNCMAYCNPMADSSHNGPYNRPSPHSNRGHSPSDEKSFGGGLPPTQKDDLPPPKDFSSLGL